MQDAQLISLVDRHRGAILSTQDFLWAHPQTGYREWEADRYMAAHFEALGYRLTRAGDIPGFYADVDTGHPGPRVALLAELDSLICRNHPDANPETGAVHACGHSAQCAAMAGLAAALREPGALDGLCGSIRLMVVPAEELIEIGYREALRKRGVIRYLGGKVEFLARGFFDGVDMAMMIHNSAHSEGPAMLVGEGCNGCVTKQMTFTGVAAHAGGSPHEGINALYAATAALSAANALRETFRDEDHIRFHPIITKGGQAVNAIPDTVVVESYVRGATMEAIRAANERVNRAMAGCAAAFGASVHLQDRPGYSPLLNDRTLARTACEAAEAVLGACEAAYDGTWDTGCTDMGDLSCVMPVVHPYIKGSQGLGHGDNYRIADPEMACVVPAKILLLTAHRLLANGAARAKAVLESFRPRYASREAFLSAIDALYLDREAVRVQEDGTVLLDYK